MQNTYLCASCGQEVKYAKIPAKLEHDAVLQVLKDGIIDLMKTTESLRQLASAATDNLPIGTWASFNCIIYEISRLEKLLEIERLDWPQPQHQPSGRVTAEMLDEFE